MSEHRWMSSGFLRAAPVGDVNAERGVIEGVSVATVGEAKGHGVNLDAEFVATVVEMGGEKKQGLKARFGHPNFCSTALGTFIGRYKNFRVDGAHARADLFLSNEAKDTPHGDLYSYVMGMAENEPDMFGTSIVFTPGRTYKRDVETGEKVFVGEMDDDDRELTDETFVECEALHACDAVDDPAANDGLFSRFSQETMAGQITEFLDLHPHVWDAVRDNPSIVEALGRHGTKVDEFVERYRTYRDTDGPFECECIKCAHTMQSDEHCKDLKCPECGGQMRRKERPGPGQNSKGDGQMKVAKNNSEQLEEAKKKEAEEKALADAKAEEDAKLKKEADEKAATELAAKEEADKKAAELAKKEPAEHLSRDEFVRIADEFGDAIATQTMRDGGDYETALKAYAAKQKEENETLRKEIAAIKDDGKGQPAKVTEAKTGGKLFNTGK